jgi:iron(III) transport system substrate-binding protein
MYNVSRSPVFIIISLLALFLFGGHPLAAAPAKPEVPKMEAPILSSLSGAERNRVAGLIQAAQQERELVWLDGVVAPASAVKFEEAFKRRYGLTDLKINHQRLQSGQLTTQVQEEVKAGRVTVDIFGVAAPRLFYSLKDVGALYLYDSPEYKYYETAKKAGLTFEPGYWMSPVAYTFSPLTNPKFYPKKITSWYDIADPQLKDKVNLPNAGGSEAPLYHYVGVRQVLPRSYFEQIAALLPAILSSSVDQTQKVVSGEHWVSIGNAFRLTQTAKQTDVIIKAFYPKEGTPMLGVAYGILAKAPHPNTAKLFIDFLFSEEGQTLYAALEGTIAARDGLKVSDEVMQYSPPLGTIKSIPVDWKNLDDKRLGLAREEWQQVFKR